MTTIIQPNAWVPKDGGKMRCDICGDEVYYFLMHVVDKTMKCWLSELDIEWTSKMGNLQICYDCDKAITKAKKSQDFGKINL